MTAHSSILVWRIPWTEEHGGLWSTVSPRAGHGRAHTTARLSSSASLDRWLGKAPWPFFSLVKGRTKIPILRPSQQGRSEDRQSWWFSKPWRVSASLVVSWWKVYGAHLALQASTECWLRARHWSGASHVALVLKNLPAKAGEARRPGLTPGLGRCPRVGSGSHSSILPRKTP